MSNTAPEQTVGNPVAEEAVERGSGHDEEKTQEVVDLLGIIPKVQTGFAAAGQANTK